MNESSLKLTALFGERQRLGHRFLSDALFDLFGEREIAASILLRGMAGFGQRHHLRNDQSLSMSEDPPVIAMAVDSAPRVRSLADEVLKLDLHGVVTLERSRMLTQDIGPVTLPEELNEATKLTVYVGRHERVRRVPAYVAICQLLHRRGIAGASAFVGVDGTAHGERERARFLERNADVPTMIIAVGSGERISTVLPELGGVLEHPMLTLERVRVCKRDGVVLDRPHELPDFDDEGRPIWQKLTLYTSESDLHRGEPVHRALIRRLRRSPTARGATAIRGVWGFHGDHPPHGDRLFQLGRQVPVTTMMIDTPAHIRQSFDIVDELTDAHGLVTTEMVPALASLAHNQAGGRELRLADHRF